MLKSTAEADEQHPERDRDQVQRADRERGEPGGQHQPAPAGSRGSRRPASAERTAANRIAQTSTIDSTVDSSAPCCNVANCSSLSATGPVSRSRTPCCGSRSSSLACGGFRRAAGRPVRASRNRAPAGSARSGAARAGRADRPVISRCQETGCVAAGQHRLDGVADRGQRRIEPRDRGVVLLFLGAVDEQRQRIEQAAQARVARQRADQRLRLDQLVRESPAAPSTDRNSGPLRSKNSPPSGRRT